MMTGFYGNLNKELVMKTQELKTELFGARQEIVKLKADILKDREKYQHLRNTVMQVVKMTSIGLNSLCAELSENCNEVFSKANDALGGMSSKEPLLISAHQTSKSMPFSQLQEVAAAESPTMLRQRASSTALPCRLRSISPFREDSSDSDASDEHQSDEGAASNEFLPLHTIVEESEGHPYGGSSSSTAIKANTDVEMDSNELSNKENQLINTSLKDKKGIVTPLTSPLFQVNNTNTTPLWSPSIHLDTSSTTNNGSITMLDAQSRSFSRRSSDHISGIVVTRRRALASKSNSNNLLAVPGLRRPSSASPLNVSVSPMRSKSPIRRGKSPLDDSAIVDGTLMEGALSSSTPNERDRRLSKRISMRMQTTVPLDDTTRVSESGRPKRRAAPTNLTEPKLTSKMRHSGSSKPPRLKRKK